MNEQRKELLVIKENGRVELPEWLWKILLKRSGIRSRKSRHVKKAIKKEFSNLIRAAIRQNKDE